MIDEKMVDNIGVFIIITILLGIIMMILFGMIILASSFLLGMNPIDLANDMSGYWLVPIWDFIRVIIMFSVIGAIIIVME